MKNTTAPVSQQHDELNWGNCDTDRTRFFQECGAIGTFEGTPLL
jgi:hypothetical protein